ncbi:hypothetical protein E2P81_ATG10030 [Venturia nashicola]|uniref:Uncharacterized protein n=1 Tax=Venturia nashicola TaxID=86259 RepID=A0A4Z1NEG7_9PEZI|nr:hypothetical protein E6O75_ATG10250 [Venturia nashicola]TLD14735.1 hypothetical protein E2P81_ATG10030 [Venturia nashicola]
MAEAPSTAADSDPVETQLTFNVKASNDQKFVLTLPLSTTIGDVKNKLAGPDYADVPVERIRLIYSGRVLKNEDSLSTHNVKDGNTIHMVKGAASNARQNPAGSTTSAATPAVPALPPMATGTANNPLAGLTGARYAGFHGLPSANMFGADGGMGAPPPPGEMLRMLEDPNFASTMNEALNNPDMLRILEQHPMMRDNPQLQRMIRNPEMRRMLFSPDMLRMQLQMQEQMGGEPGASSDFPAPGVTDQMPAGGGTAAGTGAAPASNAASNPFSSLLGNMGGAGGPGAGGANALAALLAGMGGAGTTPGATPPAAASTGQGTPSANPGVDPFASLFGGAAQGGAGGANPLAEMTRNMMQNPELMRSMMQMMGGGDGGAALGAGAGAGGAGANPFSQLFNPALMMPPETQEPADNRPPEERYESQLRQLNDMGFFEFDRNIAALRRSGGSVQGAIEHLLGGS